MTVMLMPLQDSTLLSALVDADCLILREPDAAAAAARTESILKGFNDLLQPMTYARQRNAHHTGEKSGSAWMVLKGMAASNEKANCNWDDQRTDSFLRELTDVCDKHGIGIAGKVYLYVMELEDKPFVYALNEDGSLIRA